MTSKEIFEQYLEQKKKEEKDAKLNEYFMQGEEAGEVICSLMSGLIAGGLTEQQAFKIVLAHYEATVKGMMNQ